MELKEFMEVIKERLKEKIGNNFTVKEITKNNDVILNGIVFTNRTVVYMEDLFNAYINGKTIDEIINMIVGMYRTNNNGKISYEYLTDFNNVKDKLSLKLINREKNKKIMKLCPYKEYLDFILIVNINVNVFNSVGTVKVTNDILKSWNKSFEDIFEIALNSTIPVIKSMVELFGLSEEDVNDFIYVITNKDSYFGSAAMLFNNNEPLIKIAEKFNSDLYVFPCSVHEVIVIPAIDNNIDYLYLMVKNINNTVINDKDYLSDNVYKYDKELNRISIVK